MSNRKDIMVPRKSGDKTYWTRIGVAWINDKGDISLDFEALPIPSIDEKTGQLRTRAMLFDPKPKEGGGRSSDKGNMHDDDVPF